MESTSAPNALGGEILPPGAHPLKPDDPAEIGGHRLAGRLSPRGVYLARDSAGILVVVKSGREPRRLRTEAACARRLPGSCAPRLLVDGTEEEPAYLVSEYVEGPSLKQFVEDVAPLDPRRLRALAAALARALATVHGARLIHGDLRPANVLLAADGPRLLDFGIAQEIPTPGSPAEYGPMPADPSWVAPECLAGDPAGPASDVFGWACLIVYAATGHGPYEAAGIGVPRRDPDLSTLDEPLRRLTRAALATDPAARPPAGHIASRLTPENQIAPARDGHPAAPETGWATPPVVETRRTADPGPETHRAAAFLPETGHATPGGTETNPPAAPISETGRVAPLAPETRHTAVPGMQRDAAALARRLASDAATAPMPRIGPDAASPSGAPAAPARLERLSGAPAGPVPTDRTTGLAKRPDPTDRIPVSPDPGAAGRTPSAIEHLDTAAFASGGAPLPSASDEPRVMVDSSSERWPDDTDEGARRSRRFRAFALVSVPVAVVAVIAAVVAVTGSGRTTGGQDPSVPGGGPVVPPVTEAPDSNPPSAPALRSSGPHPASESSAPDTPAPTAPSRRRAHSSTSKRPPHAPGSHSPSSHPTSPSPTPTLSPTPSPTGTGSGASPAASD
ncbi:MAG: serine/threonine protein kinase [Gaiellaceae bacterium]